jgi:uncharacterized protein DUF4375
MEELKWLDGYSGESLDNLLALTATHRVDSIVLAIEQALQQRPEELTELSEAELTVLAVEALEREVNNGGYHQFFFNTPEFAPFVVDALRRIACPETADISAKALSLLGLRQPLAAEQVEKALASDPDEKLVDILSDECDGQYYEAGEPIADRLLEYVRAHQPDIRLT